MHCPTIADLPRPPEGKSGWPWTKDELPTPASPAKHGTRPLISITTPSYNQAAFLEETIRSVLLQGYPELEYFVIDGGSTDGSVEIIRKYEPWLTYWVSKPDNGQSAAINEGWARSTGEVIAWLNSDDTYQSGALASVANYFCANPHIEMVYGDCRLVDEKSQFVRNVPGKEYDLKSMLSGYGFIPQQATFMKRAMLDKLGDLDEDLFLVMDWDFWLRIALSGHMIVRLPHTLANFRIWPDAKSSANFEMWGDEKLQVLDAVFDADSEIQAPAKYRREAYRSVHNLAGKTCYKTGNWKKAIRHYQAAFRYAPFSIKNLRNSRKLIRCYVNMHLDNY